MSVVTLSFALLRVLWAVCHKLIPLAFQRVQERFDGISLSCQHCILGEHHVADLISTAWNATVLDIGTYKLADSVHQCLPLALVDVEMNSECIWSMRIWLTLRMH